MGYNEKILEKSIDPTVHQMLDRAAQLDIGDRMGPLRKDASRMRVRGIGRLLPQLQHGPLQDQPV